MKLACSNFLCAVAFGSMVPAIIPPCQAQGVRFVCDSIVHMPSDLRDRFGERIRVRIVSKRLNTQHETFVFDEGLQNSFHSSTGGGRMLYAPWLSEDSIQMDSTSNGVMLDSATPTAFVNFVTAADSTDFPHFALGYGLYCIKVEHPYESCTIPPNYRWSSASWILDLRDSRYARSYGIGASGDITFRIQITYQDKECGPPGIRIELLSPGRSGPVILGNHGIVDYNEITPVPVHEIFEQPVPEFDFHLSGNIYRGLDSTLKQRMSRTYELTHSARIGTNITVDQANTFIISNSYNGGDFSIERDSVVITLTQTCLITCPGPLLGFVKMRGSVSNPLLVRSGSDVNSTGFALEGVCTDITNTDMVLVSPVVARGPAGYLHVASSQILRTDNQGDQVLVFADRPYAIRVKEIKCTVDSCRISTVDAGVERGSGILLEKVTTGTRIHGCTIEGFPGHGLEIVDGPTLRNNADPRAYVFIDTNIIRNNRMYGVHIRGSHATPYLLSNVVHGNGWYDENTMEKQPRKFDGINIQSANGIFQRNTVDSSGAYGLHAACDAMSYFFWRNDSAVGGKNCFRNNYYNLGGSGYSMIGGDSALSGINSFSSPRATWSDAYHVTLRGSSIGLLWYNAWENPTLAVNPYPIRSIDAAQSFADPEYGGVPILCMQAPSPGGARNDSLAHENVIDEIRVAKSQGDWALARDLAMQLLDVCDDGFSSTFSVVTLLEAQQELDDSAIPSFLNLRARDTLRYHASVAANYAAMRAFAYAAAYDSSIALAHALAYRFPHSDHWRQAHIMEAFVYSDCLDDGYAAEDILLSVLQDYPDDAQTIGAYYSVKGCLPMGFSKASRSSGVRRDDADPPLFEVYPNPARRELTIHVHLTEESFVGMFVYDNTGRRVAVLCDPHVVAAGEHSETYRVDALAPGQYHLILKVNDHIVRKLIWSRR